MIATMLPSLNSMLSRLRLKQLRLLVALGDHGSLLKAAQQVALTQPGASKALHEIENTLGVPLFARTNRGLEPNDMGHCVIRYARLIHTDLWQLREEMVGILQGQGGRVALGMIMGAVPLTTRVLTGLLARQPMLSVEIIEDTSAALLALLDRGRLDLAICRTSVSERPHLFDSVDLCDEQLVIVAHPAHACARLAQATLADLAAQRWVAYSSNMPMRMLLEREFQHAGLRFPPQLIETTSAFATLALLQQDHGLVALMSAEAAEFCSGFGMVCVLPIRLQLRSEPYQLVTRRGSPLSPTAALMMAEFGHGAPRGEVASV
jgi:DNA-binding transcriptional LysR family regulator